jgi:hypothetical protein
VIEESTDRFINPDITQSESLDILWEVPASAEVAAESCQKADCRNLARVEVTYG